MMGDSSLRRQISRGLLGRYALALGITALGLLARWALDPELGDVMPYTLLFPGLAFLSLYVGLGPTLLSIMLGGLGVIYWFVSPRDTFEVTGRAHIVDALTFLTAATCLAIAGELSRRSRTQLQRTQTLLQTFLNNSPGAAYMKDKDGRYVYVNQTTKARFGEEFVGKTDAELFPARYAEQLRSNDLKVLRENKAFEFIEYNQGREDERVWLSAKFPVTDADGRKLLGGKSFDITEQKRAEEKMRTTTELLRSFLDAAPGGLTRCSCDLRYLEVNPAYARMAGLPVDEIVGRSIIDVMGTEAWETIRPHVEQVLRGERVEYEMPLAFASGGFVYVHVVYTPERNSAGEVVGWVASVTDVTESKRVEKQLTEVEKLAAAGQLAAALAHEINNPLSAVTNALYLLQTSCNLDKESRSLTDMAANELERVARIVRQSLAYYRVGANAKEVDLGASVEESLQIFGERFQRAGVRVRTKIASKTLVMGYPHEIRQVVDNLLLNALEATPSGGRLAVAVRRSRAWKNVYQGGVRLTIADSGQGIPKEQMAKIFEPFFTTKAERGTGLGLWVVQGVVAKHDGAMKFRSATQDGKSGTVVSILWPSHLWLDREQGQERSESAA
jgi:PAS domain S-box-containing protein